MTQAQSQNSTLMLKRVVMMMEWCAVEWFIQLALFGYPPDQSEYIVGPNVSLGTEEIATVKELQHQLWEFLCVRICVKMFHKKRGGTHSNETLLGLISVSGLRQLKMKKSDSQIVSSWLVSSGLLKAPGVPTQRNIATANFSCWDLVRVGWPETGVGYQIVTAALTLNAVQFMLEEK